MTQKSADKFGDLWTAFLEAKVARIGGDGADWIASREALAAFIQTEQGDAAASAHLQALRKERKAFKRLLRHARKLRPDVSAATEAAVLPPPKPVRSRRSAIATVAPSSAGVDEPARAKRANRASTASARGGKATTSRPVNKRAARSAPDTAVEASSVPDKSDRSRSVRSRSVAAKPADTAAPKPDKGSKPARTGRAKAARLNGIPLKG